MPYFFCILQILMGFCGYTSSHRFPRSCFNMIQAKITRVCTRRLPICACGNRKLLQCNGQTGHLHWRVEKMTHQLQAFAFAFASAKMMTLSFDFEASLCPVMPSSSYLSKSYIYILYLEPGCPLFSASATPQQGRFQSKEGSFAFQLYMYNMMWAVHHLVLFLWMNP